MSQMAGGNWEQLPAGLSTALSLTDSKSDARAPQRSVARRTQERARIVPKCREVNTQTNAMLNPPRASLSPASHATEIISDAQMPPESQTRGMQKALSDRAVISMSDPATSQDFPLDRFAFGDLFPR
jgi:hypothetical protein